MASAQEEGEKELNLARGYYGQRTSLGWGPVLRGVQLGHLWDSE